MWPDNFIYKCKCHGRRQSQILSLSEYASLTGLLFFVPPFPGAIPKSSSICSSEPGSSAAASSSSSSTSDQPGSSNSSHGVTISGESKITLLVDNTRFVVDPDLFNKYPDTMLGRMFNCGFEFHPNSRGEFEVAEGYSAAVFSAILGYYSTGLLRCPPHVSVSELREAADYLLVPFAASTVRCHNLRELLHELSNDGAQEQFESFLEELILPKMVKCAARGDRECHIVVLMEEDQIEWDDDYPPQMGEEYTQTIYSTPLYR